jgi:hypothetical protein
MCSLRRWRWRLLAGATERLAHGRGLRAGRSWFWGAVVALPVLGLGGLVLYYALAYGKSWDWVAFALVFVSVGAALHAYYLWAPSDRWFSAGMLATKLAALVLAGSLVALAAHALLW